MKAASIEKMAAAAAAAEREMNGDPASGKSG